MKFLITLIIACSLTFCGCDVGDARPGCECPDCQCPDGQDCGPDCCDGSCPL